MKLIIRTERKEDYSRITEVIDLAFMQKQEGRLVEKLRKNPDFIPELSLVAEFENQIVGHILFFPIEIKSTNVQFPSLALAPMSVVPEYRRKGVGKRLVSEGLKRAKRMGFKSVIVLGHSEYYPKFGFVPASKWNIKAPFSVPDNVFFAIELAEGGLKGVSGTVEYPEEFNDV